MFNSFNVYKTEWLDLVFADRNKNYGAYELRSKSSSILTKALLMASAGFILFFVSPMVYKKLFAAPVADTGTLIDVPTKIDKVYQMKKREIPKEKPAPKKAESIKVKTVASPAHIVVVDKKDLLESPTIEQIKNAIVSDKTQDGEIKPDLVLTDHKGVENGNGPAGSTGNGDIDAIVGPEGVDEYPEFTGGMKAWAKYIQRSLRYPSQAQDQDVQGKVFISFVVEKDGSITDVKLLKGIGYGCDEEAMKVIKKSPLWKPGKNRGIPVRVRYNMPISFTMI